MKKSRTETWVGISGVGKVVLLSVAIVKRVDKVASRERVFLQRDELVSDRVCQWKVEDPEWLLQR